MIGEYDAVIAGLDPFSSEVIRKANKLKIIARRGIGFDKVDLESCRKRNIFVTNTPIPEEHQAVAEFTVGLIFDLIRNISKSSLSLKGGSWERAKFLGEGIQDITIGIIGLGKIGARVANLLSSLGSHVIYSDPYVEDPRYSKVDLSQLFRSADVVTIHTPKTNETFGMVNRDLLKLMKKGSCIVNTARGEVMNMQDLYEYMENGTIDSVAMDVFEVEPPENMSRMKDSRFLTTPHIAAYSRISFERIDEICYNNVRKVLLDAALPEFVVS